LATVLAFLFSDFLRDPLLCQFPSQIAACLQDPLLQHLMAYAGDRVATARFHFWLQHALTEEFLTHSPASLEDNERLLKLLVDFTDFLQVGVIPEREWRTIILILFAVVSVCVCVS
jgi:hypothetical protein